MSFSFMYKHFNSTISLKCRFRYFVVPASDVYCEFVCEVLVALEELNSCTTHVSVVVKVLEGEIEKVLLGDE